MVAGNVTFPIYNSDGTSFNGLELKKSVYESVVMSLGDKITGDVYYPNNALVVTMKEYITYNGVKYVLVNPPTIVREGMVSDNGELKGMTKYSFTFYHPMYMLGNFPLCDVAVSSDQQRYLSENKTFFWIGNLTDFVAKLNKNLENTEWYCVINDSVSQADRQRLSEVMSFDKNTIADALKTGYETWDVPYIISIIPSTDPLYQQGKRFLIQYGLPSTEILVENAQNELVPFVFHFGQGVGLKNNSRTPRNNKIVTRIAGYGSEDNIQYGYPQIPYEGGDCQYPLYYGIVGGQRVQLIKHPFTRTHLMPSIYRETVNKKVNPMATGYDPTIELKDYYDADNTYENQIKPLEPSYEIHEFEKIKPELGQRSIVGVSAYSDKDLDSISLSSFISLLSEYYTESEYLKEKEELEKIINTIGTMSSNSGSVNTRAYYCDWSFTKDERYAYVKFESSALNFEYTVLMVSPSQDVEWDDTMDDDGNYVQSYFRITIPQLTFDLYASAAITQEMTINMRSGACLGCSFPVMVDWDDYKLNFYDADGNFAPNGSQRNYDKYPDSIQGQITLILQKETSTFGTLMPNIYQKPHVGDEFVILGISLPTTYITEAEARLDAEMKQYMRDNNVYYYDYPLKFDEHFLTTHAGILAQMDNNVIVRFDYAGTEHALYIKQVSVKYENKPLPTYDITLTDNIEVVLNQIGQVVDEVRRLHDNLGGVEVQPSNNYLRKDIDDTAYGMIRLIKGLQVGNRFVTGLLGEGGVFRKEEDGTTYLECDKLYVRMKAYFDTVEVRHYMHSAGNRVASNAGINCSRVEYIDSNGDVTQDVSEATLFRCYFRANDDGREVRNDFVVGDLAFCRETNVNTDSVDQHGYWRAVVGRNANGVLTDDGEGWIDLSVSDCQEGSGIPIAQDDIVQLGNKTDTTRQGAIIEFVSGADAPSYQIYQGINTYSLNGKNYIGLGYNSSTGRAYLNVYGDAYIGDPNESSYIRYNAGTRNLEIKAKISAQSTIDGETLAQFISENTWTEEQIDALITAETDPLSDAIEDIRRQVDGNIATWFYDGEPTLQNLPASQWTTADDKNEHLGDLYYDNLTGYAYRFKYDDLNRQWSWMRITDVDVTKALADAAKAQDTADHKRRVFVVQPTPPYDAGDLWVNATYPTGNTETNEAQSKYYNDVLRCKTSKASGTTFAIADWSLASKYTDDQALEDFKANQYVTALTNGTISTNITNAQNAANTAQGTANSAATAAASAQAAAQAADSRAAALEYIKTALNQKTDIEGGLILTSLIAMRDGNNHYWSGISGAYKAAETGTGYKGHGIAAWYGGAMVDKEVTTTATDYAKSLFRFDGSGYVASGNLSWDKNGNVNIQGYSINATTLQVGGNAVATQAALADYVTLATGQTISGHKVFEDYIDMDRTAYGSLPLGEQLSILRARSNNAETGTYGYKAVISTFGSGETGTNVNNFPIRIGSTSGATWVSAGESGKTLSSVYTDMCNTEKLLLTSDNVIEFFSGLANDSSNYESRKILTINSSGLVIPSGKTLTIGDAVLSWDSTNQGIKITKGLYSETFISALGAGSGGSSGGIDMTTVWTALGNATTEQINATHLSNALSAYNKTSNFKTINGNSIIGTGDISISVTGDYLPLSGGTMTNTNKVTNLNADYLDGLSSESFARRVAISIGNSSYRRFVVALCKLTADKVAGASYSVGKITNVRTTGVVPPYFADVYFSAKYYGDYTFCCSLYSNIRNVETSSVSGKGYRPCKFKYNDEWYGGVELFLGNATPRTMAFVGETNFSIFCVEYYDTENSSPLNSEIYNSLNYTDIDETSTLYANTFNGTATSATKLQTPRTIWGQSFDGTANVSGNMTDVGNITSNVSGEWGIYKLTEPLFRVSSSGFVISPYDKSEGWVAIRTGTNNITTGEKEIRLLSNGNVGIGTKSPSYKLHVAGTFYASGNSSIGGTLGVSGLLTANGGITIPSGKTLTIGDAVLSWDSTNQGIKITKGLYSQTFIAALGQGSSGSSGVDMNTVWTALGNATTEQINSTHLSNALSSYATQSWVLSQIPTVVDAYTKTESDNRYYALYGGTNLSPSSTNPVNIDTLITAGNYYCSVNANTQYVSTLPSGIIHAFRLWVGSLWTNTRYIFQRIQQYGSNNVYERYSTATTTSWSDWYLVQDNLANYVSSSSLATTLSDYVTIAGTQTITGAKTFTSNITIHTETTTEEDAYAGLVLSVKDTTTGHTYSRGVIRGYQDHGASDSKGFNLVISGGGNTFISSGESAASHYSLYRGSAVERLFLTSDGTVYIQANANTIGNRTGICITTGGNVLPIVADEYSTKTSNLGSGDYRFGNLFVGGINADGEISLATNNKRIHASDKDGTVREVLRLTTDNILAIGFGLRSIASSTGIYAGTDGFYVCTNGSTRRMFIDSSGNVGIGTTSPSYKLSVSGDVSASNFRGALIGNADSATTAAACTGNAASATKLQTSRSIWGQSFDGSADISGAISGATTISASSNVSVGGNLTVTGNVGIGTTSPSYALDVVGQARAKLLFFYNRANNANAGYIGAGSATVDYIYFQAYTNNGLYIGANDGLDFVILPNHNVGVGTTSPSYKFHVDGVIYSSTGVYSGGYVTALSDIRHKDVQGNVNLTVSEVANAPSVKFLWKDRRQEGMQVGSIAQYWKKVMPEAIVENADGELTMSYGVIALLASIATARKVEDLERRVVNLEKENKLLKEQLNVA